MPSENKRPFRITVLISGSGTNLQALIDASSTSRLPNSQITYVLSSRSTAYGLTRCSLQSPPIPTSVCALKTFLSKNPGKDREDYDEEVARRVVDSRPDLVVLAGWMHILSERFLDVLEGKKEVPSESSSTSTTSSKSTSTDTPTPSSSDPAPSSDSKPSTTTIHPTHLFSQLPPPTFPIPIINLHPALPLQFDGAAAIPRAHAAFQEGLIEKTGVMVHRVVREVDRGEAVVVREVECRKGESLEGLEGRIHEIEHEIIVDGARIVLEGLAKERGWDFSP